MGKKGEKRDSKGRFLPGHSGGPGRGNGRTITQIPQDRLDSWSSVLTGIGNATFDKSLDGTICPETMTQQQCQDLWRGSDLASKAVEIPPAQMLRPGFDLAIPDVEEEEAGEIERKVKKRWRDLGWKVKLRRALEFKRAYGAGALLLGIVDGRTVDQPLDTERASRIDFVNVLERREFYPVAWDDDPLSPGYGEPSIYRVQPLTNRGTGRGIEVHASRLIIFDGERVTKQNLTGDGFGDSVFVRMVKAIRNFDKSHGATAILLNDFSQAVWKMRGLADLAARNGETALINRARALELGRSTARAVLLDAEGEEFERKATPVQGLADLLDRQAERVSAATSIPQILLFGRSPGGLNATGDAEIQLFYDWIDEQRRDLVVPATEMITRVVFRELGITEPEDWEIEPRPLWQPTEKEQAETRETNAKADVAYVNAGVYTAGEVAMTRSAENGPHSIKIDKSLRDEDGEIDIEEDAPLVTPAQGEGEGKPPPDGEDPDAGPLD